MGRRGCRPADSIRPGPGRRSRSSAGFRRANGEAAPDVRRDARVRAGGRRVAVRAPSAPALRRAGGGRPWLCRDGRAPDRADRPGPAGAMIAEAIAGLARFVAGASVFWVDRPPDERQRVYFANHTSHLDFVVLWSALPAPVRALTRPVAGRDYWERGAVRRYLSENVFRAILIDRSPRAVHGNATISVASARRTIDRLAIEMEDRYSIIVFPEGTRGSGEEISPFKSG